MVKKTDPTAYIHAKDKTRDNLEELRTSLNSYREEGLQDLEELQDRLEKLIDIFDNLEHWDTLQGVIEEGKILEQEIDAWLAIHKRNSYSLSWPKRD